MISTGVVIGGSILVLVIYNIGTGAFRSFFPESPPSPLVAFGKLPTLNLSEGFKPPVGVTYRIETVSGTLKELPLELKVFSIDELEIKFGDTPRSNSWAESLGFTVSATNLNSEHATYSDKKDASRILTVGVVSQRGKIDSNYFNNLSLISTEHRGDVVAKSVADRVVAVFGLEAREYPDTKIEYIKYKIDSGNLVKSNELSAVNLIQVNYNRSDIDKIPVDFPVFQEPKTWVLTSNDSAVAANVDLTLIQEYKFSTYPLKGIAKAFDELKAGKASYNMKFEGQTFDIRDVRLGYLDTVAKQKYLQPVYVFMGNSGLKAYVRAVADSYVEAGK